MPRIRIKGKGLPKAQYQNSQVGQPPLVSPQQIPMVSNPGVALAPLAPLSQTGPQLKLDNSQSDFTWNWQNQGINGQSNAIIPKQTVVNPDGSRTTTGNYLDLGRTVQYATDQNANGSPSNSNATTTTTTTTSPSALGRFNNKFDQFLNIASAGFGYIDNKKKQREYDKWAKQSRQPHNYYAVDTRNNRGDYDINDGMFRPNEMGYKSKGTQANPYQASATFARDGGLVKAAEGMLVPGDQIVNAAFLPDIKASDAILAPRASAPAPVAEVSINENPSRNKVSSSGVNPMASQTWNDYSQEFKGLTNLGIWGDKSHKARKSDHNTGDALDVGIKDINQGSAVAQKLIEDAKNRNVKYIIFNNKIWNPSISNEWRPYTGKDPHKGHVHVSFNRSKDNNVQTTSFGNEASYSHNNPMNVHYGNFAAQYGAKPGVDDTGGKVAIFPDLETGIRANKDLMFGPGYNNLTISQARNKWVTGNSEKFSNSTSHIVKAMGGDRRLADLNSAEKDKLFKEFAKWEGKQGYNLIKDRQLFDDGGQTNNMNMKIRIIGTPEENQMGEGGQPSYSGQSDYGLYIGQRNLYKTMAKNPYTNLKSSVSQKKETKDDPYVLEAEGGETILRPDGSHMNITGDRHTEGGEKLTKSQAPKGSFIYSDTKKMRIKNPEVLKHFGKTGGNPTPAQLAKQYDVNKYKAILSDPNASVLSKNTAKLMVQNYQNKLAQLALVQESMKGFPQGVPEVAKGLVPEQGGQQQPQAAYGGYFANDSYAYGGSNEYFQDKLPKAQVGFSTSTLPIIPTPEGMLATAKVLDPTGILSWGDARRAIKEASDNPGWGTIGNAFIETLGALPIVGKVGKVAKGVNELSKFGKFFEKVTKPVKAVANFKITPSKLPTIGGIKPFKAIEQMDDYLPFKAITSYIPTKIVSRAPKAVQKAFLFGNDINRFNRWEEGARGISNQIGLTNGPVDNYAHGGMPSYQVGGAPRQEDFSDYRSFKAAYDQWLSSGQEQNNNIKGFDINDPLGVKKMIDLAAQGKLAANSRTGVVSNGVASAAGGPNPNAVSSNAPAWFKPWINSKTKAGRTSLTGQPTVFDPQNPNKFYTDYGFWKQLNGGKEFSGPQEYQNFVYNYVKDKDPKAIDAMWQKWGTTAKGKGLAKDQQFSIDAFSDSDVAPAGKPYFGARTAEVTGWREQTTTTTTAAPGTPTTTTTTVAPGVPTTTTTTAAPGPTPTTTTTKKSSRGRRGDWTSQDIRNFGNSFLDYGTLKKYHGYSPTVQPVLPEFIPQDWRGYAATQQANANSQAQQLGTFQPGQGMASNLSFLAGQQAGNLGDYISKVDQYNASGATAMDAQRAQILNQATALNAAARKNLLEEENIYDDRFRGAERGLRKGIVKTWNQGEENASKIYNLNQVESPYYTINPYTQRIQFNDANAKAAWEREQRGSGSGDATSSQLSQWNSVYNSPELAKLNDKDRLATTNNILGFGKTTPASKQTKVTVDPVTKGNKTTQTTYDEDDNPIQSSKFGGSIGASFVKSIGDWYSKLNYIADPNERQRVAEAYAHKMHFGK